MFLNHKIFEILVLTAFFQKKSSLQFACLQFFTNNKNPTKNLTLTKMNSRKKPTENVDKDGTVKKSYCDKQFKRNLVKALKNIQGEPDSIEKLLGYLLKHLFFSEF